MRPSPRLLMVLLVWSLLGLLPGWYSAALIWWLLLGGLILLVTVLDAWSRRPRWRAERSCPPILAVGVWRPVRIRLYNDGARQRSATVFDHFPQPSEFKGLPVVVTVPAHGWVELSYRLQPVERGQASFGQIQLLLPSPFGLWRRNLMLGSPQPIKVFPNFATIAKFALLAHDNRVTAMGIHLRRRRGEGQDFFQLREYREGDSLRQIDWKATARQRKLISKEYQEERDQRVVFLLDCGRRMRAQDAELSHFDHVLNALILLAYVALRQGDSVGLQSFGGVNRWLAAKKGATVLNSVINSIYDLQPTLSPADYQTAATRLMARQRKRALVVVLTNLRDEDSGELLPMLRLLRQRHLVLVANLRESALDDVLQQSIKEFADARLYASTCHYMEARDRCQEKLRHQGAVVLDSNPAELPVALVNHYLAIKRSGKL